MESEADRSTGEQRRAPLRLFVAARAPEPIRRTASETIAAFRSFGDVRWATPERLHLTLKFLGNTPAEKLPVLEEQLTRIANTCLHPVLRLDRIGAFPSTRRPQTVWYGLGGDVVELAELASRIEAAMEPLGFKREGRPWRPHLTLGRVRSSRGLRDLATELERRAQADPAGIEWRIDEIALVHSDLKPTGPLYTELSRFPLATTALPGNQEQE